MAQDQIQTLLGFFKALADESRLKIIGILANRDCSVEELAATLELKAPTVSHHLNKLKELGLVEMSPEGNTHVYSLNAEMLRTMNKELVTPETMASLVDDLPSEAWERKVLRDFLDGERLKEIPASRKKRVVILRWLAGKFQVGEHYPEAAVNEVIKRHHPDFATLRRELIGHRFMQRENNVYWRIANEGE